jgi:hypothetical protein
MYKVMDNKKNFLKLYLFMGEGKAGQKMTQKNPASLSL